MKIPTPKFKSIITRHGFALVATITVMSLLAMITLGIVSLSARTSKQTSISKHRQLAEANARMALQLAVAKLQTTLGPDTRITAPATVLENPTAANRHWIGVVNTRINEDLTAKPANAGSHLVDHHESPLYLTDIRNGNKPEIESYLVSSSTSSVPSASNALDTTNSVLLYQDPNDNNDTVRAPLVKINDKDGGYSYWISDNSMKNSLQINQPNDREKITSNVLAQKPNLKNSFEAEADLDSMTRQKILSLSSAELVSENTKLSLFEICGFKEGLFTNTMKSGLRKDLSAFIASGTISPRTEDLPFKLLSTPVTQSTPIFKDDSRNATSPRMGIFKTWADLRFAGTESGSNGAEKSMDPVIGSIHLQNHKTVGAYGSPDNPMARRNLVKNDTANLLPVVVEASLGWDFSPYTANGQERLRAHLYPRLTLWNPYNVTIKSSKFVVLLRAP